MTKRLLIAQISDLHVVPEGQLAYGVVDTRTALESAIASLLRLERVPDMLIISGDLVETQEEACYKYVKDVLSRLEIPTFIVPGNHDSRDLLLNVFPHIPTIGTERFVGYAVEDFPLRIIGLDSTKSGTHLAEFCSDRVAWLDDTLAAKPEIPTLIILHHPPFLTGVDAMDFLGVAWSEGLHRVILRHEQVTRITCGHHHRAMAVQWAGRIVTVAPSVAHQFPSKFQDDAPPGLTQEPPGMLLHWWSGENLVTHVVPIDLPPIYEFFKGQPERWRQAKEAMRNGLGLPEVGKNL